MKHLKGESK